MPVEREFLDAWVSAHSPYAYHVCQHARAAEKVLNCGLLPAGEGDAASRFDAELQARPGHVYLALGHALEAVFDQSFGRWPQTRAQLEALAARVVRIDLRALDPRAFSPDEDCCYLSTLTSMLDVDPLPAPGAADPDLSVRDRLLPGAENEPAALFAARPYRSYGEWAEREDVGSDTRHTQACWRQIGSLAHRGRIGVAALTPPSASELAAVKASGLPVPAE